MIQSGSGKGSFSVEHEHNNGHEELHHRRKIPMNPAGTTAKNPIAQDATSVSSPIPSSTSFHFQTSNIEKGKGVAGVGSPFVHPQSFSPGSGHSPNPSSTFIGSNYDDDDVDEFIGDARKSTNDDHKSHSKGASSSSSEQKKSRNGTELEKSKLRNIRDTCGMIVNHHHVQNIIILMIVINSIMMGVATFPVVYDNPKVSNAFELTDRVFLSIFTIELGMQIFYRSWRLFTDGWLVFDLVVVVTSWAFQNLQIIRAFRIFRALRLITRIDTMRRLVGALLDVMPRMFSIGMLMMLVFYVFAVMFTQMFKDLELEEPYFVTLDASFFTLFQMMTLDWAGVARECMQTIPWAWFPFVLFIMISSFIVFNLVIAVICDAVAFAQDDEEDQENDVIKGRVKDLTMKTAELAEAQQRMMHSIEYLARQVELSNESKKKI